MKEQILTSQKYSGLNASPATPIKDKVWLKDEIKRLKKEKNAILLAHYYQVPEIQDLADFVGDSLALAQQAAKTNAEVIVLAGVHFMAETAKILNPNKKVLLPDLNAGCSLADSCPPDKFSEFLKRHPGHVVITYVNCSAAIKAMSDIVCTSGNAEQIVRSIPKGLPIIFGPDKNLGKYLEKVTGRKMVLWDGACEVHEDFSREQLVALKNKFSEAKLIAHPECVDTVLELADFIGSTAKLLNYAKEDDAQTYIVVTEEGILHKMRQEMPDKKFIPGPATEPNACACSRCRYMRMNTLEKLYNCLQYGQPEIVLEKELLEKALLPIQKMLQFNGK